MAIKYDPKRATLALPKGDYQAVLVDGEDTHSKMGKPMLKLVWRVYADTRETLLTDYIVDPLNTPFAAYRLKKLAEALGEAKAFESGTFDALKHMNAGLTLTLDVEESEKYGEQNRIRGVKPKALGFKVPEKKESQPEIKEEDIPF